MRAKDGRRTQTLKSAPAANGAAASRGEWEWSVRSDRPDIRLLVGTPAARHLGQPLLPIVVTDIQRTTRMLTLEQGTTVEVAIDEGTIQAGGRECPVHELELELKAGPVAPLYRLALALQTELPLRLEAEAKAVRGLRLRDGVSPPASKISNLELERDVGAAEGFRRIMGAALGSLVANQPAAAAGDPEGVHQMRIAVRRVRTVLTLFKPHLAPATATRFEDELRRLGQALGQARDWDVFALSSVPAALNRSLRVALQPAAEAQRQEAIQHLRTEFARPAFTGLVLALAAWAEDEALLVDEPARQARLAELAPELLDRLAKKVAKRGRHISRLSGPELHSVRKSLKKLRYAVEDMADLFSGKQVRSFRKHCTSMQAELGCMNDAAMAASLAGRLAGDAQAERQPAVGAMTRWSERRLHKAARKLPRDWKDFRHATLFWN